MKKYALVFAFVFLFSACSAPPAPTALPTPVAPPVATSAPLATNTPPPTATSTQPAPILEKAQYYINAVIDYDAHQVTVNQTIEYPNHTGAQLNSLALAVVPNLWTGFNLQSVSVNGETIDTFILQGQRLELPLSSFLLPNTIAKIEIAYTLNLPFAEQEDPNIARPRIYGYTNRQMNLVNWYPFVVPRINGGWVLHDPWYYGEHLVYDAADYVVDVRFTDPAAAPMVAASGAPEARDGFTRYTIRSARTFALAASREFESASTEVNGVTVTSYYFPLYKQGGRDALKAAAEALALYSEKFGAYKHKTLSLVMGDFNDGMEYSAFFYLSRDFYNLYRGDPKTYLIFVAAHETSHQWWFDQIANDQAQQPWVDEALATYSEYLYYEHYYPELTSWWWAYRIDYYNPQGFVDIPIYEGQGFRPYTNAAYFQGAHFLHDLRERIGDEAFFNFIRAYTEQGQNKIVTAQDFFNLLKQFTQTDYSDIVRQYFRNVYP